MFVENDTSDFVTVVVTDFRLESGGRLIEVFSFFLRAKESILGLEETSWALDLTPFTIVLLVYVAINNTPLSITYLYSID